jgi:Tol biopolymer transport system component
LLTGLAVTATAIASLVFVAARAEDRFVVLRQGFETPADPLQASVNADGRFVAFVSRLRLLPGDSNVVDDIYVFDRTLRTLTLESLAWDGSSSNGGSGNLQLSADGRLLIFDSDATNLTEQADRNASQDVFLRDRTTGVTVRISVNAAGEEGNAASQEPAISADGRIAAFASRATNLVGELDANGRHADIYVTTLTTREHTRISVDSDGHQPAGGDSFAPTLSRDGRVIAFMSTAPLTGRPVRSDTAIQAVFVHELATRVTSCLSCSSGRSARHPHVSHDGRFVAFTVWTGVARSSTRSDIVLYDRTSSNATVVTSRANASSSRPQVSGNGRFVVFESEASNLECGRRCPPEVADENLLADIYLFDSARRVFERVSRGPGSWWAPSVRPSFDADGSVVVFSSRQPVGPEDMTPDFDLFIRQLRDPAPPSSLVPSAFSVFPFPFR